MRPVKCKYCGQQFSREKEEYITVGNRYAHKKCHEDYLEKVQQAKMLSDYTRTESLAKYKEVMDFARDHFGQEANYQLIQRQLNSYITNNGYTYNGILKSLIYYYDVKNNPTNKANGAIGIVPYIYEEAKRYYYYQHQINKQNEDKKVLDKTIIINANPYKAPPNKGKLFSFLDKEDD